MPNKLSADKSLRRENKRNKLKSGMRVVGRSALFNRVVNQRNKKRCPGCGKEKNKKARLCKECLINPTPKNESLS